MQEIRLITEQILAGARAEAETTRRQVADTERALGGMLQAMARQLLEAFGDLQLSQSRGLGNVATSLAETQGAARLLLETKLHEMSESSAERLAAIQKSVNEQLHAAVETQMTNSFQRVIDQFSAVQKAMGDVQAVTAQIGDIKRIFSNVKSRGGWAETQLRVLLDDILQPGGYQMQCKLRPESDEMVDFAIPMPMRGDVRPLLPIDAKFPLDDYERLLAAAEAGDAEGEKAARRGLEIRLRFEAKKIHDKYIHPPVTVEFGVLYLPTDGLYTEMARIPGLIEQISSEFKVLVLGPSLAPALLRTIQLGFVTLSLEQKAGEVGRLLGATRTEMLQMDKVLERLLKQAGTFSTTIERARRRTSAVSRKLRNLDTIAPGDASQLLELEFESEADAEMENG